MAEEVSEGKQSEHGREENQSRENGENKEIRKRRRNLHQSTIVCGSGKENTGMTVARQTLDAASPVSLMFASIW